MNSIFQSTSNNWVIEEIFLKKAWATPLFFLFSYLLLIILENICYKLTSRYFKRQGQVYKDSKGSSQKRSSSFSLIICIGGVILFLLVLRVNAITTGDLFSYWFFMGVSTYFLLYELISWVQIIMWVRSLERHKVPPEKEEDEFSEILSHEKVKISTVELLLLTLIAYIFTGSAFLLGGIATLIFILIEEIYNLRKIIRSKDKKI